VLKGALLLLALPALLAGCLAGEPAAPARTGQIDGAVVDHLLRPYGDQEVRLLQLDRTDATSPLGGFTFRDVPVGVYTVTTSIGGISATQLVDVEEGRITRVILQLVVPEPPGPYASNLAFTSKAQMATPGVACDACAWDQPLEGSEVPVQIVLEADWPGLAVAGERDLLDIVVADQDGFPLYRDLVASPLNITLDGADLPPGTTAIKVRATFGPEFTPQPAFQMDAVLRLYYGATREQLFAA
jgi:hypothetical protein